MGPGSENVLFALVVSGDRRGASAIDHSHSPFPTLSLPLSNPELGTLAAAAAVGTADSAAVEDYSPPVLRRRMGGGT